MLTHPIDFCTLLYPLRFIRSPLREQQLLLLLKMRAVGFDATTFERQPPAREGKFVIQNQNIELMFVTLDKK